MLGIWDLTLRSNEDSNQEHDMVRFAFFEVQLGGDSADRPLAFVSEFFLEQILVPASLIPASCREHGQADDRKLRQSLGGPCRSKQKQTVDSIKPGVQEECKTQEEREGGSREKVLLSEQRS